MRLTFETLESRALVTSDLLTSVPLAMATTDGGTNYTPTAAQTASASANPTTPINFSLVITDQNDQPIVGPLLVGQTFFIDVYIDDERGVQPAGVVSAQTDLSFDSTIMTPSGNPVVEASATYPLPTPGPHGNYNAGNNPNLITNVNGSVPVIIGNPPVTPPGAGPLLLDRIQMTATAATGTGTTTSINTVPLANDPTDSNSVMVGVDSSAAPGSQIGQGTVSTQILAPVSASLTGGSATAGATATTIQFTASLSGAAAAPVTIHYATADGTATAGTDYTGVSDGTVQIATGAQSANFNITVAADTTSHAARDFNVHITGVDVSPTGLVTFNAANQATGTITFGTPNVAIADASIQAGASATSISFPVTLSGASDKPVVLNYSTTSSNSGDTAVAGTDYTQETDKTLTIPAGSLTSSISIPIPAQSTLFSGTKTFHVNIGLDGSDTSGAHLTNTSVQGSITAASPNLTIGDATAQSSSTASTISFPIHVSQASSQPIVIDYSTVITSGDTAVAGTDFTGATNHTLTIPANTTDTTIQIPISAQSTPFGTAKTFHLNITKDATDTSNVQITDASAVGSITSPAPTVSIGNATVQSTANTGTISFPVHLNGPSSQSIVIDYTTSTSSGDTAVAGTDFTAQSSKQLTIAAGVTDTTIQIPIAAQSTPFGAAKTFHVTISKDSSDTSGAQISTATAVGSITSPAPTLTIGPATAQAGANAGTISFPVHLNAASNQAIVVDYSTSTPSGDTAVAGTDFTAQTSKQLTIAAGVTDTTIQIPILAQSTPFGSTARTFHVTVSPDSSDPTAVQNTTASAVGSITSPAPTLSIGPATVQSSTSAGGMISFTVHLNGPANKPIVLDYTTSINSGDTALSSDFTAQNHTQLNIAANATSATISIPIAAQSTSFSTPKTFHLTINTDPIDTSGAQISTASAVGTITSTSVSLSIDDATAQSSSSAGTASFTVHLSEASSQPIVVNYSTVVTTGDTAVAGTDFTAASVTPLTIPANTTTATIQIPISAQSTPFTTPKTFHLTISSTAAGVTISHSTAVGTINSPAPTLSIGPATAASGSQAGSISFPVNLSGPTSQPITLDISTASIGTDSAVAGTDYTQFTNQVITLTLPAGATSTTISIPIAAQSGPISDKTFHLTISKDSLDTSGVQLGTTSAVGTITSEPAVAVPNPATDTPTKSAPSVMTFNVQLQNQAGVQQPALQPVTVQYRVVSDAGDTAVGGSDITQPGVDYLAVDTTAANPLGQPLVIPAGFSSTSINIPIAAEFAGSGTKTFHLEILSVSQGAFVSNVAHSAVGTINLNQIPKPVASIANSTLVEPSTTPQNMQFTVTLSAPSNTPVTLNYVITPGTALANSDYTPPAGQGSITIPALATSATISVPILPDANVAPSAKFQVTISTPSGNTDSSVNPAANTAMGTILTNGSFSGTVYVDTNNDGVQESGEHILPGVSVTITGTSATGQAEQFTTTSGANGTFSIAAIPPGTYTVTQTTPSGYVIGSATAGSGASASGSQMTFTITSGDTLVNNNFAERGLQPQLISRRMFLSSVIA